ncbi:metallophosphoesterase [Flaviaesturariibacter amylovorans]|uniref:Phosphodiesterase YaeI n=1 Tax=Flaviaesturariibacter amylovorans TaxID=1084520 RepID=A0ABP8G5B4_9BACT
MRYATASEPRFDLRTARREAPGLTPLRVAYLSDLHFRGGSGPMAEAIAASVETRNVDLVLLGGDYADSRAGWRHVEALAVRLAAGRTVLAIGGNHDRWWGLKRTERLLQGAGCSWIHHDTAAIDWYGARIRIDGDLPRGRDAGAALRLLCLHAPLRPGAFAPHYDVAFAGHLHGGQVVLWRRGESLYPAKWLYPQNVLARRVAGCDYYVSKGLGDTLPLRWNCRRDLLLLDAGASPV